MANKTIPDYTAANTIDSTSDEFLLWQNSSNSYKKINRNTILGVTGQPADTSTAQSISNKTLGNTNVVTLLDNNFTLQDNLDSTKQAQFQLSGITTATTRTYTLPNASSTLADISTAQTFTNKTLTSPVITGGSISNSAVSVDSVSEFTSGNGVTVDGLNIKDGKLNTNNSVVSANITDASVTIPKLNQTGAWNSSWAFSTWTPTLGGFSSNPSGMYFYTQIGKIVTLYIFQTTNGTSNSTTFTVSLPVTAATRTGMIWQTAAQVVDNSASAIGLASVLSGGTVLNFYKDAGGNPCTASGSKRTLGMQISYEAA